MEDDENGQNMIFLDCFNYKLQIVTHGFLFVHWICNVHWNSFAKVVLFLFLKPFISLIARKDEMVDSFAAEIQILGYIRHRNIVRLIEILSGRSAVESQHVGDGQHIVEGVKKMASFEPAVLDTKLQSLPDQMVQEMLQTLGIAMFWVNSSLVERPTMKEVVNYIWK
ncbi:hypothetical protein P8452_65505 [Trifolium repens]|nr:hypothetical protein P8452_65505 [Trifolium repens]